MHRWVINFLLKILKSPLFLASWYSFFSWFLMAISTVCNLIHSLVLCPSLASCSLCFPLGCFAAFLLCFADFVSHSAGLFTILLTSPPCGWLSCKVLGWTHRIAFHRRGILYLFILVNFWSHLAFYVFQIALHWVVEEIMGLGRVPLPRVFMFLFSHLLFWISSGFFAGILLAASFLIVIYFKHPLFILWQFIYKYKVSWSYLPQTLPPILPDTPNPSLSYLHVLSSFLNVCIFL